MNYSQNTLPIAEHLLHPLYIPSRLYSLDALMGGGLPELGLVEVRGDRDVNLSVIAERLARGYTHSGADVVYFSIAPASTAGSCPKPIPAGTGEHERIPRGRMDVFRRSSLEQVERDLTSFIELGQPYSVIIIDDHTGGSWDCPDGFSECPAFSQTGEVRNEARESFLKRSRDILDYFHQSMIVFDRTDDSPASRVGSSRFVRKLAKGSPFDARVTLAPWSAAPKMGKRKSLVPRPDYAGWISSKYPNHSLNLVPLYLDEDGGIDDEMSLAGLMIMYEAIPRANQGFGSMWTHEPPEDLEALRDWVLANPDCSRMRAINIRP